MKIALLGSYLPPANDGVGDHAATLARTLAAAGHEVVVISVGDADPSSAYGLELVGKNWNAGAAARAIGVLHARRVEAVVVEYTPFLYGPRSAAPLAVLLAAKALRARSAILVHEAFYPSGTAGITNAGKAWLLSVRDAAVISSADVVAVPSETRSADLARRLPWIRNRIVVVPIGANIEPPPGYQRSVDPPPTIVSFGVVMPRRRLEYGVRAVAQASESGGDIHFDIIGRTHDPAYATEISDLAAERGIAGRVRFAGELAPEQLSQALGGAAAAVHTPREGAIRSSGSLLALLAHGVPTVALRTPYDDAIFADAVRFVDDERSLGAALLALSTQADARNQLAAAAARCYDVNFAWAIVAERLQRAIANGRAAQP
jgi:glycosyltransferase involved in cell wall biosynthesis